MKKKYTSPLVRQEQAEASKMLAASGVNGSNGIGFGGVDNNSDMEPSTKEFLWESDDFDN